MSFNVVGPQHVVHESGFQVFVVSRDRVGYSDDEVTVEIEVEFASAKFGSLVTIYRSPLYFSRGDSSSRPESEVLVRIVEGLSAMGAGVQVVE